MKTVYITQFGGPSFLELQDVERPPSPVRNQILIKIKAAALNRADLLQRKGLYPAPKGYPERIPGLEFAGEVAETGPDAGRFAVGDRVFGITAGGAQAEQILVNDEHTAPIPENLSWTEAAAIPEAFVTAHDAVWTQGQLAQGETLLIHAVGSGVGLAALQIAKAKDNKVIGTSRNPKKLSRCVEEFSLDLAIETSDARFAGKVKDFGGADVVLDLVGGAYFEENLKSLNLKGRLIAVGLVGGRSSDIDLGLVLTKRLSLTGTVLRSRTDQEKASAVSAFEKDVLPLIASGKIKPNIDRVFPLAEVAEAHRYLESNESFGKVVLELG
jgi:putative PIG3 family NAD(P)H quinone oxidoreductase